MPSFFVEDMSNKSLWTPTNPFNSLSHCAATALAWTERIPAHTARDWEPRLIRIKQHVGCQSLQDCQQDAFLEQLALGPAHPLYRQADQAPTVQGIFTFMTLCLTYELGMVTTWRNSRALNAYEMFNLSNGVCSDLEAFLSTDCRNCNPCTSVPCTFLFQEMSKKYSQTRSSFILSWTEGQRCSMPWQTIGIRSCSGPAAAISSLAVELENLLFVMVRRHQRDQLHARLILELAYPGKYFLDRNSSEWKEDSISPLQNTNKNSSRLPRLMSKAAQPDWWKGSFVISNKKNKNVKKELEDWFNCEQMKGVRRETKKVTRTIRSNNENADVIEAAQTTTKIKTL